MKAWDVFRKTLAPWLAITLLAGIGVPLLVSEAHAASRLALVIGNDSYNGVQPLKNARADARAIAAALTRAGYRVETRLDLTEKGMKSALREFKRSLSGGDEAVFFFAGHGVQLGATNYLLPIDIKGDNEEQVRDEAIPLQRILDDFQEQKAKFTLAIVDACRDNPFKGAGRAIGGRGLAPTTAATGQMVIFSAGAGQQALDRLGAADKQANGLFTRVFLKEMERPGVPIDRVLKNVRQEVASLASSVRHEQVPALYDQALGEFFFYPAGAGDSRKGTAAASGAQSEAELWTAVERGGSEDDYTVYLNEYPKGRYSPLARQRLKKLQDQAQESTKNQDKELVALLAAAPKPHATSPQGKTRSGLPMLYSAAATDIKAKAPAALQQRLLDSYARDAAAGDAPAQFSMGVAIGLGVGGKTDLAESLMWHRRAADQGFASAQGAVAYAYSEGRGVTKNPTEAARWARLAAEQGLHYGMQTLGILLTANPDTAAEGAQWLRKAADAGLSYAQRYLGYLYLSGTGLTRNEAEGIRWYRAAFDSGDQFAAYNLGRIYQFGWYGVTKDLKTSVGYYRQAAEQGYPDGMSGLGNMYLDGLGVEKNLGEAVAWYRKAAEKDGASGMANLGYMYENGFGVDKNVAEAFIWFRRGAEKGSAYGMNNLGRMYENGIGVDKNPAEALSWRRKAAEKEDARAMADLGRHFQYGIGTDKNYPEAINWYRKAAQAGNAYAMNALGVLYQNGNGTDKDATTASTWYRKAADAGNVDGMSNLGRLYRNGNGVAKDDAEALRWFRKAADQGEASAMSQVGYMYENGLGVEKSYIESIAWYRKAAEKGDPVGMNNLGAAYEDGRGVEKNLTIAIQWYRQAEKKDNAKSKENLKRLGLGQ